MSDTLAMAAVTAVLKGLLDNALNDDSFAGAIGGSVTVKALAPDRIKTNDGMQLNLFLHHVTPNPGWRSVGLPSRNGEGERSTNPPLALDLHYLLTAYGLQDFEAEMLLGVAMQTLHETPVPARDTIRRLLEPAVALSASGLAEQVEQIKITPQPMSTEEISKLWTAFQTNYRPSAAYHVSVVLIESQRHARSPLPVLTRGRPDPATGRDEGIISRPDLVAPFPTLQNVTPPNEQPAVRMGEVLTLSGHHLSGDEVVARFTHARSPRTLELPTLSGNTSTDFLVQIPNPAFNRATVVTIENTRLLVLPGGNDPDAEVAFADAGGDSTAGRLLLTAEANTLRATLSGEHADDPDIPASPRVQVTIGNTTRTATLAFPPGVGLPNPVPLTTVAPALQSAIRRSAPPRTVFARAIVRVAGDRLLVLPGGNDPDAEVAFADAGGDSTAGRLLLTAEANTLRATLSGEHADDPDIPASPRVQVTIGNTTRTATLAFPPGVGLPNPVPLTTVAPALQSAIRSALSEDPASDPVADDSPQNPDNWQAGVYSIAAMIRYAGQTEQPERTTSELPVVLAPRISSIAAGPAEDGSVDGITLTVKCTPKVRNTQRVTLVVGGHEISAEPIPREMTDTLIFRSSRLPSGEQWVRLRVDGVDSILIDRATRPPVFDDSQKVEI